MMDVRAVRSEADYAWALSQIEAYFEHEPEPGTPDGDRFDVLATLIEAYEAKHFDLPAADPIDILLFAIESLGRSQDELAELLGTRARVAEILHRSRPLTPGMIRTISEAWRLPVAALTPPYALARGRA